MKNSSLLFLAFLMAGLSTAAAAHSPFPGKPLPERGAYRSRAARLPVKITVLTAAYNPAQQVVNLRWSTVLEKNNERFIVERSVDSLHFSSIGETRSAGNTETAQHYYFDDPKPIGGTLYYRLREVDADGKEYLSEVVNTSKPITQLEMTSVRLGEDHTTANLEIAAPGTVSASLILADVKGKVLKTFQLSLQRGTVFKSFYVGDLKAGVYFLQLNDHSGGKALLKKFSMD